MEQTINDKKLDKARRKVKAVKFLLSSEVLAVGFILIISIITTIFNAKFWSPDNILLMLRNCSFIGIMSIGQALIIMSGEMDLSVGSVSYFASVVFGMLCIWDSYPTWVGLLAGALFAAIIGWLNGFLMLKVGIMKWVATLATSNLCGGLAQYLSLGVPITPVPQELGDFGNATIGHFGEHGTGLSIVFLVFIGLVLVAEVVLRYTKYGRMIQASGISANSAYMAGINVRRVKWITLIFVSLLAYAGGMMACMRQRVVNGAMAGANFKTISACYIGGIGFVGSSGSVLGLLLGVILIQLIENSMSAIGWDPNVQIAVIGGLVMLVLSIDVFKRRYMASRIDLI